MSNKFYISLLCLLVMLLFLADILLGSVYIPLKNIFQIFTGEMQDSAWSKIIWTFRFPKAITAVLAGAALAVSGLQMQTLFRNPLAGPYVLGISSGASLGVALLVMASHIFTGLSGGFAGNMGIVAAASIGSLLALFLIVYISEKIRDNATLLIIGLMLGHVTGAIVGMLQYFSTAQDLQSFIIWTLGSFNNVVWDEMKILLPVIVGGLLLGFAFSKPLNALLLGDAYARSMGVNVKSARFWIILSTGLLAGSITAFCGPVAFLGLAIPHLTRAVFHTSDHRFLIPAVCLVGAVLALFCDIIAQLPGSGTTLPVNAVTSLVGAPVVIWVIMKQKKF
jgi:iron complex transport system permease protein